MGRSAAERRKRVERENERPLLFIRAVRLCLCVKIRAYSYPTTSLPPSNVYGGSSRLRGAGPFLMRPEVS